MSLSLIKNTEIIIDGISGYGAHRVQSMTKAVVAKFLDVVFTRDPEIMGVVVNNLKDFSAKESEFPPKVLQQFPYNERTIPSIIINAGDVKEKRINIGSDNIVGTSVQGTNLVEFYTGAAQIPIDLAILTESPDTASNLADIVAFTLSTYFRWHYFFVGDDNTSFSIAPVQAPIKISAPFEVEEAENKFIHGRSVFIYVDIQYIFTDNLRTSRYELVRGVEVDPKSGPQESIIP